MLGLERALVRDWWLRYLTSLVVLLATRGANARILRYLGQIVACEQRMCVDHRVVQCHRVSCGGPRRTVRSIGVKKQNF